MRNLDLSVLEGVKLAVVQPTTKKSRDKVAIHPVEGDFKVFKNGRIYPSVAFAEKIGLDYSPVVEDVDPITGEVSKTISGYGIDIISSKDWEQLNLQSEVLLAAFVPKGLPKIDLFGSVKYDENNKPTTSIFEHGVSTGGKKLVALLERAYDIDWDLNPSIEIKINSYRMEVENGLYYIPKEISRGDDKGQFRTVKRENIEVYPIEVVESTVSVKAAQEYPEGEVTTNAEPDGEMQDVVHMDAGNSEDDAKPGSGEIDLNALL